MVGPDKGLEREVRRLIAESGLEAHVSIKGPVSNKELHRYYHSHAVLLNTPSFESFGMAVLEAAACGIPVVSTAVGEIPLLWKRDEDILLAENISAAQLAQQVERCFSDREFAARLACNARKKAEAYGWGNLEQLWKNVLGDLDEIHT
jgi:glycosyltransferase involved in cell wall biosynthesis